MTVLAIIAFAFGVVAIAFGISCYVQLYKWARECQGARIAIAYKGKVQMNAPLVEWMLWTRMLKGKEENGRVVYRNGQVTVAILKRPPRRTVRQRWTIRRNQRQTKSAPQVREGSWSAKDETVKSS